MKYTRQDVIKKTDRYRLYSMFRNMNRRCNNKNVHNYEQYGGSGIRVIWKTFESFYSWAIKNGYNKGLEIDRKNSDGNYSPSNCRFVTSQINQRNKKSYKGSATPYINVYLWKNRKHKRFYAYVTVPNIGKRFLGSYDSAMEAAIARDRFMVYNGIMCKLNFPTSC